jgi:hypothetical protein
MLRIKAEVAIAEKENDIHEIAKEAVDLASKLNCQIEFNFNGVDLTARPVVPFDKRTETIRIVNLYHTK